MKQILPALPGGLAVGLCVWGAQNLVAPQWGVAISGAVGAFLGVWFGQKLIGY
ncbi:MULTISPECIES: hypothetical protein [Rhizobium/Agrobacterium group]|uniref:hypothetical protein n=1 Tax=Rhizobium/Agrobacterium group TaxID=227290 RepID=UPI0012E82225|nr:MULTISPECIES: hypothetical protein [Rhizobium/Agrobacterium group]MVA48609.1 hypothetical protein [Agrobacterium vitis]MVA52251.1 hypothetical protein [Agrobacterium vitis]NSZ45561.1 hypothetical protein [Agrobacterium vitis]NSZ55347.1 hypothetical protein [Agrobacterium vitis]NTA29346.1 hypothetical protein [Allorhizobium ampelinum]